MMSPSSFWSAARQRTGTRALTSLTGMMMMAMCAIGTAPAHAQSEGLALEVKATFLVKFGAYVTWPPTALPDGAPLTICTTGGTLDTLVDAAAQGQNVGGHPVQVRHLAVIDRNSGCQIAYLGDGRTPLALAGVPVLTITDDARPQQRGMINFRIVGGRVRFTIDQVEASAAGLTISSKLLQIALSVRQPGAGG